MQARFQSLPGQQSNTLKKLEIEGTGPAVRHRRDILKTHNLTPDT